MNLNNKRRLEKEDLNQAPPKKQKIALYLADYTPIRTIEVSNIGDNVCSGYLRGYFEHAVGPVSGVTILKKSQDCQEIRTAFVTFLLPEDAAELICDVNSNVSIKFAIKEADSIHQPKIDPNVMHFEDINYDCLLHITSYLDLIDIVNLGKTSTGLQTFVQGIYRRKPNFSFATNTGDSSINELNLPIILQEMGGHIQSIEWQRLDPNHLDFLSQYCPNVNSLRLTSPKNNIRSVSIKKNRKFFKNLKSLDIQGAKFFDATLNAIISFSPKLKSLRIIECHNIYGKFFSKWKSSKLKCLKVSDNRRVDCENVHNFLRNQKLTNFFFDAGCSFGQCLSAPSDCLMKFKELELDFSSLTDEKLNILKFEYLKKLTVLTIARRYAQMGSFNNVLAPLSQVKTLKSLNIHSIEIDGDTIKQLGLFKNLQKLSFNDCMNRIGNELYTSIPTCMPNLTTLSMQKKYQLHEEIDFKWICDMISSLENLKYFSHSSMTWKLLDMILKVQLDRKQSSIEIGVSKLLWDDPMKMEFAMANKGAVILSLCE